MILFLHGYQSSSKTNKFTAITDQNKYCANVNYDSMDWNQTFEFYAEIIAEKKPTVLVGHSLGGYWAMFMGCHFGIPVVLLNPQLQPRFYHNKLIDIDDVGRPRLFYTPPEIFAYVETGDEIIDVETTIAVLSSYDLTVYEGGHHRLERPEAVNTLIQKVKNYEVIG
jgi:predicted esterase YcpF (UPF0227 family)